MKKIRISPLFFIWVIFLIQFQRQYLLPLICAVALHELGHIGVALILKIKIKCFRLSILGARMETATELSYRDEFLLAAGGPFLGFLGFAASLPHALQGVSSNVDSNFVLQFAIISLVLTLFNLIPLSTLDGGRMLFCLVCRFFSLGLALRILRLTSFFTLFAFWIFSVYMVIKISSGLSMLIFCSIFFVKCFVFSNKNREFESF